MGMLDSVLDLFPHEVTIEPFTGQDRTGEATYGAGKTYRAKIERGSRQIASAGNAAIIPQYKVFIGSALFVDVRDRLTLPTMFGERTTSGGITTSIPVIRQVMPVYDEMEQVCAILYCG